MSVGGEFAKTVQRPGTYAESQTHNPGPLNLTVCHYSGRWLDKKEGRLLALYFSFDALLTSLTMESHYSRVGVYRTISFEASMETQRVVNSRQLIPLKRHLYRNFYY